MLTNSMTQFQQLLPALPHDKKAELAQDLFAQVRARAKDDFEFFVVHVFSASFDKFVDGQYIRDVAKHLADNNFTMDVTGRDHFKSTRLYADIMWALLHDAETGFEGHYFSYTKDLASYHLAKIKEMVANNPYYTGITDLKKQADGVLGYSWNGGAKMTVKPAGLLTFKRGIHANRIYIDDALRDPENKMKPTVILKINRVMKAEVLSMVNKGGICRIVGTPQTPEDFFFDPLMQERFNTWITPAIQDEPNKIALWPEWKTYQDLMDLRNLLGDKIFNAEYMASPVYSEDSYLQKPKLMPLVREENYRYQIHESLKHEIVVAGFDIGKKVHPSHLAVFVRKQVGDKITYRQIFTKWMDGWDYRAQLEYLVEAINCFNISILRYDNTRGEFEGFGEQNMLPHAMKPVVFNAKNQTSIAAHMGSVVDRGDITFVNDARQTSQILAVNNDLDAMSGPEGHGDSFWSVGMAIYEDIRQPNLRFL